MKKAVLLLAVVASAQSNHPMAKADVERDMKELFALLATQTENGVATAAQRSGA